MNRLFLLLLFLPIVAFSQRYLWPTNASPYMTSSFCEYRPGHYHSAIDIKTWNREGYPIYAVDDGRIYQIRVSPFGYGKALYLKLKDGRLAVYGHLQKFTPEIERVIRKLQIKNRRYTVTWRPESWPVKRGQVLGYTGQTGIGVPHLHFEIRSDERHPLNPLRFYPQVKDRLPPRLQSLLVIPQNASSRVDGSFLPRAYALQKNHSGEYVLKQPIKASGIIGFALRGYDQANGVYNKFSFYSLELIVNRTPLFRMRYDTLDFSLTAQVDVEIYYPFKADSNRVFHKLYIEPFNRLPFYQRKLGLGLISVNRDTLPFKIIASDFFGNRSVVKGKIIPAPSLPFGLTLTARQPDVAFLSMTLPRPLSLLRFYYDIGNRKWRAADAFEILRRTYLSDRQQMLVRLPLPASFNSRIKVRFAQAHFATDERIIPLDSSRKDLTETGLYFLNDRLVFAFRPPFVLPEMRLALQTDEAETPLPLFNNSKEWQAVLPARLIPPEPFRVALQSEGRILADTTLRIYRFTPGLDQSFRFFHDSLTVSAAANSLYDTLIFALTSRRLPDSVVALYPIVSPQYRFHSAHCALRKGLNLTVKTDNQSFFWRQLGFYALNGRGELRFLGGKADSLQRTVSGRFRQPGAFFCAADTIAPELQLLQPVKGSALSQLTLIQFKISDSLSGIGSEDHISITIDGHFVVPEWDPERDLVFGRPHWKLSPGQHELQIRVTDRAGNSNKILVPVYIKP